MTMTHALAELTQDHPWAGIFIIGIAFALLFLVSVAFIEWLLEKPWRTRRDRGHEQAMRAHYGKLRENDPRSE